MNERGPMKKNYDPLLHADDYQSYYDMQDDVLEWWYEEYDKLDSIPLWKEGCPDFREEYGLRQPSLAFLPYQGEESPKGVVLVSAGGAFLYKAHHEGICVAERFAREGYLGAVLDYRVFPYTQFDAMHDVNRAVRLLRSMAAEYGYPQDNIALVGFSAGGHASLLGGVYHDEGDLKAVDPVERYPSRPGAIISCYSAFNYVDLPMTDIMEIMLGKNNNEQDRDALSVARHIPEKMPPVFLWASGHDSLIDPRHSMNLAECLCKAGIPFELHIFDGGEHGIGLADETNIEKDYSDAHVGRWVDLCLEWLGGKFSQR